MRQPVRPPYRRRPSRSARRVSAADPYAAGWERGYADALRDTAELLRDERLGTVPRTQLAAHLDAARRLGPDRDGYGIATRTRR